MVGEAKIGNFPVAVKHILKTNRHTVEKEEMS